MGDGISDQKKVAKLSNIFFIKNILYSDENICQYNFSKYIYLFESDGF